MIVYWNSAFPLNVSMFPFIYLLSGVLHSFPLLWEDTFDFLLHPSYQMRSFPPSFESLSRQAFWVEDLV